MRKMMIFVSILFMSFFSFAQSPIVAIIDDFSHKNSHGNKVSQVLSTYKGGLKYTPEIVELNLSNTANYDTEKMIRVAIDLKVNVINLSLGELSLGYNEFNYSLFNSLKKASDKGIWIVVAAGNNGQELSKSNPMYPCMFKIERLICVGSVKNNKINPESNKGSFVFMYADGTYKNENATSFAAPRVAQSILLFLQNKPTFTFGKEFFSYTMNDQWVFSQKEYEENLKFEYSRRTVASAKLPF